MIVYSSTKIGFSQDILDGVLVDKIELFARRLASQISTDVYNNWLMIFKETEKDREIFEILVRLGFEHKIHEVFVSLLPKNEENRTVQSIWLAIFYAFIVFFQSINNIFLTYKLIKTIAIDIIYNYYCAKYQ